MRWLRLVVPGVLLAASLSPVVALAQVARVEIHTFSSVTLTDQEFLTGSRKEESVVLAGELRIPAAVAGERLPAMVLVHGSGGILGFIDEWAQYFNGLGIATFTLDSFTGRGIISTENDQLQLGRLAMIMDAYRALDLLARHPRIDPEKIALMGFSRGGQAVLYSSLKRFQRAHGPVGREFAAYIAFYPSCGTTFHDDGNVADKPIRLFHGSADDYVPVAPCRSYVERLRRTGKDIQLTEYPNAHHGFDASMLQAPLRLAHAQTTGRCDLREQAHGQVVNRETGRPFTYADACVGHGATVAFDAEAYAAARAAVGKFVAATLKSK